MWPPAGGLHNGHQCILNKSATARVYFRIDANPERYKYCWRLVLVQVEIFNWVS